MSEIDFDFLPQHEVAVTVFDNVGCAHASRLRKPWHQVCEMLCEPDIIAHGKLSAPLIKMAVFGDNRNPNDQQPDINKRSLRYTDNILKVSGIEADYDAGVMRMEEAVKLLEKAGIRAVLYSSWGDGLIEPPKYLGGPRWRVIAPFSQELPPEQRARMVARLNGALDGVLADESFTLAQGFFIGARPGGDYKCKVTFRDPYGGAPIDTLDNLDEIAIYKRSFSPVGSSRKHQYCLAKPVTDQEFSDLRDALEHINSDDRQMYANSVGMALKTIPEDKGKDIWLEWSARSSKFSAHVAEKDWRSFKPMHTHWRHIFNLSKQMKSEHHPQEQEPVNFFKSIEPCEFNVNDCFPEVIADWASAHSACSGLQAFSYACAALPVLAAVTDRTVHINLGGSHFAPIILWTALVGATGSGKSPAMNAAHRPLSELNAAGIQQVLAMPKKIEGKNMAVPLRYISDTTPEALTSSLGVSPGHRLLVHIDEGSGWLNDMGRYSNKSNSERATYLTAWLGQKNYLVNRVTRGVECIPELGVSMLYGITPHKIQEGYKEASAEGLLGRTMLFLIDRKHHKERDNTPKSQRLMADTAYAQLVMNLTNVTGCEIIMCPEAACIYEARRDALNAQAAILEESHPGLAGALAKAAENMGRVAGLYALCRVAAKNPKGHLQVEAPDMEMAARFMDAALSHAHSAYTGLLTSDEVSKVVLACASKILRMQISDRDLHEIERDQLMKVSLFSAADRAIQNMAIERLGIYHWLLEDKSERRHYGPRFGDGAKWSVNRLLFDGRFGHIAKISNEQAVAIHEALKSLSKRPA